MLATTRAQFTDGRVIVLPQFKTKSDETLKVDISQGHLTDRKIRAFYLQSDPLFYWLADPGGPGLQEWKR